MKHLLGKKKEKKTHTKKNPEIRRGYGILVKQGRTDVIRNDDETIFNN